MRATKKKQAKKTQFFLFPEINLVFFGIFFFYLPKLNVFSQKIGNNSMRALGRKKTHVFLVVLGLPLMRALI